MVAAQDVGNLVLGGLGRLFGDGRADDASEVGLGHDALHDGGVGGKHQVVLVHSHAVVAFLLQYPNDAEGDAVEADYLADGVAAIGEEVIDHCLAEDADLGCRLDIGVGEHLTVGDLELAYTEVVLIDAVDGALGIVVAVNPLPRAVDRGRDGADVVAVFLDALVVGLLERLHG